VDHLSDSCFAGKKENLHTGAQISVQLRGSFVDLGITPDNCPSLAANPRQPVRVGRTSGCFVAAIQAGRCIYGVAQVLETSANGPRAGVLV
jgi:hypothetical protein